MEFINGVILIEAVKSMPIWLQITAYFVTLAIFVLDIYITFKVSRSIAEGEIIKPLIAEVLGVALLEPVHIKIASKIIAKVRFPKYRTSSLS